MLIVDMEASIATYCLSLLLLTSIRTSANSDDELISSEPREPRVSGRIVKLYSGAKLQPYLCPGEGFQPDLNNCAVFYRCVKEISGKFTVFRYQCAPGTVYDIDLETCNHPQSTKRSECGGMLKTTAEPAHTLNINEINGAQSEVPRPISIKIPIYTEQTTLKTPTLLVSTERHNTPSKKQGESTTYTSPIKLDSSEDKATHYQWLSTKHHATSTSPPNTIQPSHVQNDDQCMSDGFMGDSENCRKFYRCVRNQRGGYVKYEFSCSELTIWDDEIQGCNHPWAVKRSKCGRSLSYSDRYTPQKPDTHHTEKLTTQVLINNGGYGFKSNKTTQQQLQISYGSTSTQTQTQISNNDQIVQNQTQIHYGDPKEKNNKPGLKQNQKQQSYGTAVSQIQTQLDYGYKGIQTQVQIDHSKDSSQSQVQTHESTTVLLTSTEHHNNIRSNECSESGFMGDPNDCKKFYRCVNNGRGTYTKFEYFCGDGTVWDPELEACNHEWAVNHCGGKSSSEPTTVIPPNTTTTTMKSTVSQTEPTRTTTQSYYTTSKVPNTDDEDDIGYGNQNNHNTTPSSITTMKTTTTTVKLTTSSIVNSNETYTECTSSGFIGDLNDCKIFYRCVNSGDGKFIKYEFKCGDGTLWDPDIEACNHAWAVKHCGGKVTSEPTVDNHTTTSTTSTKSTEYHTEPTKTTQSSEVTDEEDVGYGNQNNQDTSSSPATTTTTIKSTSTTSEKSNGAETNCISSGFMGDANDCKVFYRCVDNGNGAYVKYEFKCGDGTLWDPDIEACNHAWAVKNCRDTKPNNVNKEETTTMTENTTPLTDMQTTITLIQNNNQGPTQNDDYDIGYGSQNSVTSSIVTTTKQPQEHENHKNSECKSSGFIGDENDCKKFYRCVDDGNGNYNRYEFTCGEGTVWDPTIEACNHAWAVKKCGGSNPVIESTETSSQPIFTTNNGDTSIMFTTQSNKDSENSTSTTTAITSSTTTSSGTNDKCSNGGFIGDDSNCKKFYRCVDNGNGTYTRYEFTCGDGTVWDPKIEACNHAWAVEKCGGTNSSTHHDTQQPPMLDEEQGNGYATPSYETSEKPLISTSTPLNNGTTSVNSVHCDNSGFIGDKNDCKKFYRCVDNGKGGYDRYEFNCGEGTRWDQSIEACNHAWAVKDCRESELSTTQLQHESTSQSNPNSEEDHAQQSTEKTTTTSQIHHENELSGGKCVQEGFFVNNFDCKKFYRCVDNGQGTFIKYEFTCGEGTLWNQDKQSCDHASDVLCNGSSQEPIHLNDDMDSQTISSTKTTTSATVEETSSTQVTKKPQLSQNKCESEGFYGNPSDCKKFYRCVANGSGGYTQYDFSCGDGTVWNQDMLACDHESAHKMCTSNSSNQSQVTLSQLESTTNSYSTTTKQNSTHTPDMSETTNTDCTSDGFYAHPQDCKKFIRCVSNGHGQYTRYEFSCGDGTVWVQEIQACDHDNEVSSCSIQDSNSKPENHEQYPTSTPNGNFISSTEGVTPNREDDEYDSGILKDPSHDETDDCTSEGYFANKQDCRKFHRCVDNGNGGYTKYDFTCGDGTAWDSNLQTCNHINQVQSCSESSQDGNGNQQTTTNKNEAQTNNSYTTTQATMSTSSLESSGSNTNSQDKCKSEGYFGDSKDCKNFYRCVDNGKGSYTKYDFTCGDGTIWDQDISNCNYPQDVSNPSCTSESGSTDITSTTSSTTSTSQITSTTENSSNSQVTSDCTQESSKKPENNITCDKAGYYANPNDCKKFYRCVDWDGDGKKFSVFHFECGEGTIWDPALDTCNHEDSVYPQRDCSKSQSQNVGGDTTTPAGTTSTTNTPSSTSEQTTQESATNEQTTTPQSVTSEQTTTEQTATEQTTTQQSTTSEKSTTEEQTTAQETKPTSDKTTTQESTTSEQTTIQQSTTSDKTTTQGSYTSDKTTTQEPTTNEQATMQPHTTGEPTTTTKSTTDEQTTTQQSENTTTLETTTSELTQQSTTNKYTTEEPTTSQHTIIQESTTNQQTTTQDSTTSQQTTTQESTISSTQPSTTTDAILETTSTEQTTVQQSTMTDQTTTQHLTSDQTTTESSNEQSSTTTEETSTTEATQTSSTESDPTDYQSTTEMSSSNKDCPETEHDQYLLVCPTSFKRHPKYCNMFYQCIEDEDTNEAKVAMFKCPNNTIYDETQTQCLKEDKVGKKCDGEIANKRRFKRLNANYKDPIVADKGKQSCATAGYFSFEKQSECSKGFLKCEKSKNGQVKGHVYQCPDGFIYWSVSKRCERVESVRDCKRSFNDWTGRWNIPVERNNIASS